MYVSRFSGMRKAVGGSLVALAVSGCGSEEEFTLQFAPMVGDEAFQCGTSYQHIGTGDATITALDFRLYLHDVTLVQADGKKVPLTLEQDGIWQRDNIAFLDFENGSGACQTGSPETRTVVVGTAARGEYVGVEFTLGLPLAMNHLDAATAPAPLNIPGMWWSWSGGYKFVRLDVKTETNPNFYFHLGETNCDGTSVDGYACDYSNLAHIAVSELNPATDTIMLDLKDFYADSDLDEPVDYVTDYVSGCMAFSGDPECEVLFNKLGMTFEDAQASPPGQTLFRKQ